MINPKQIAIQALQDPLTFAQWVWMVAAVGVMAIMMWVIIKWLVKALKW